MDKIDLKGITLENLQKIVEANGEPKFRAAQILDWLYNRRISNRVNRLEDMGNISKSCIEKLLPITNIASLKVEETDGSRHVFVTQDSNPVHSILKKEKLLLATQIGCSYKCKFCPYGRIKLVRSLTTGEIVDQVLKVQAGAGNIQKIGLSGMGEPLANLDAVLDAIKIINSQWGLGFPLKDIYISTCGLVPEIKKIANTKMPIRLRVGLHSLDDKTRSSLMEINDQYPVDVLLNEIKNYGSKTGTIVELEYILLEGINDSYLDSKNLIKKLLGLPVKLFLIIYEPVSRARLKPVNMNRQEQFLNTLIAGNLNAEISE